MAQLNSVDRVIVESDLKDLPDLPCDFHGDEAGGESAGAALTFKQQQALEWLMGGGTITEAAELIGVKRQTVSRWVNHHAQFCNQYQQWQEQMRTSAEARVLGLTDEAINNLAQAVRESHDLKASQFVLKLMGIASHRRR